MGSRVKAILSRDDEEKIYSKTDFIKFANFFSGVIDATIFAQSNL